MNLLDPLKYRNRATIEMSSPYRAKGSPIMTSPSCRSRYRASGGDDEGGDDEDGGTAAGGVRTDAWVVACIDVGVGDDRCCSRHSRSSAV